MRSRGLKTKGLESEGQNGLWNLCCGQDDEYDHRQRENVNIKMTTNFFGTALIPS